MNQDQEYNKKPISIGSTTTDVPIGGQFVEATERMKERILKNFLSRLNELAFVKSTDSVTGEETELNPVIKDMEAIIEIQGQFGREDLKNLIVSISG